MFSTGFVGFDRVIESSLFSGGNVILFRGSGCLDVFYRFVAVNAGVCVVVDGGGSFNPYRLGREGDSVGVGREDVLKVLVSRAFTGYQVFGLIEKLWSVSFSVFCFLDPLVLFKSGDMGGEEGLGVFENCLAELKKVSVDKNVVSVVFSRGGLGVFEDVLDVFVDEVVYLEKREDSVKVRWRDRVGGFSIDLDKEQTTIDRYIQAEGVREFSFPFRVQKKLSHFVEVDIDG
ncbi:RecA/RadA recombinase inactivated [Methanonatronarchaeum thermophilum]|uniref:RecA/RadA recombinase inactivated n=1 Tax=Methanonatronarchaeum thermophilum TaxID=1927129 RepID=A0A1Y3GCI3_9EURY|nr:hypothetical protein [Methanonatronarchaeum thermophilum]OUJ19148.1 RecA/RadA recombinase inactivated [Methanonatronarchaeum thermophilum]